MEHRRMGYRFEKDWSDEEIEDYDERIVSGVTIPVNVSIEAEHRVLDLGRVEELLRGASLIVLLDCTCRKDHGNCDAPIDVCIFLDERAERSLKEFSERVNNPREATLEEALDALRRSHEAGLVHMVYTFEDYGEPNVICSCCSCCCHSLAGVIRFGIAKHVLTSNMIAEDDNELCSNCGTCVGRCQFGARSTVDGEMRFDDGRCFGCGLCVTRCPVHAIRLVEKNC